MEKFKERWNITSNFQLGIIFLVFAINGSLSVLIAKPILNFVGITTENLNSFVYYPLRIILIFLVYQFTLIIVGALFGQKEFFLNFSKKMWSRFGLIKAEN